MRKAGRVKGQAKVEAQETKQSRRDE